MGIGHGCQAGASLSLTSAIVEVPSSQAGRRHRFLRCMCPPDAQVAPGIEFSFKVERESVLMPANGA